MSLFDRDQPAPTTEQRRDILADIERLVEDLEKMKPEVEGYLTLRVESLHDQFEHVLTPAAKAALAPERKVTLYLVYPYDGGGPDYTRAIYLSAIARTPGGVKRAAEALYGEVNKLAEQGVLKGHLCKLSMLSLRLGHDFSLKVVDNKVETAVKQGEPYIAVFCFPHVPAEWRGEVKYETPEGGKPTTNFDCDPADPCFRPECPACEGGPGGT